MSNPELREWIAILREAAQPGGDGTTITTAGCDILADFLESIDRRPAVLGGELAESAVVTSAVIPAAVEREPK